MSNVSGLNNCIKAIDKIGNLDGLANAMDKAVLLVERDAKKKCPTSDGGGTLRASIYSNTDIYYGDEVVGQVGSALQYAPYVEYGTGLFAAEGNGRTDVPWCYKDAKGEWHITSGQHPQPFLIPALTENRSKILDIIKEGLTNG